MPRLFNRLFVGEVTQAQCAALPFRRRGSKIEIALVTSRGTGRWVIPKGWPQEGCEPWDTAANEAYEEAGLKGTVGKHAIGSFRYLKKLHLLASTVCDVEVFPLEVEAELADWPESGERERAWFKPRDAAEAVDERDLSQLIYNFAASNR